jgi:Ca2+-binding EF-hand superfamily protein
VTEFPVDEKATPEELVMLADYLSQSNQSIFQFFQSIDLDNSGTVDGFEFQRALKDADIANLPPWEMGALLEAVDLDGDGKINLPELDIALTMIRSKQSSNEEE